MKRVLLILVLFLAGILSHEAFAQKVTDSAYRTVGHIEESLIPLPYEVYPNQAR